MRVATTLLASVIVLSSCAVWDAQKSRPASAEGPSDAAPAIASKPAASIVDEFRRAPEGVKQATLTAQLDAYKQELAAAGKYDCCVKPGCNECVINTGECHCRIAVQKSGPCCGECTAAWVDGRGNIPGVDREKVLEHLGCVRELYEKQMPPDAIAPPPAPPQE